MANSGIKDLIQADGINNPIKSRKTNATEIDYEDSGYQTSVQNHTGKMNQLYNDPYNEVNYQEPMNVEKSVNTFHLELSDSVFNLNLEINNLRKKNDELEQKNKLYRNQIESHNLQIITLKDDHKQQRIDCNAEREEMAHQINLNEAYVRSLTEENRNYKENNSYQARKIKELESYIANLTSNSQKNYLSNNYNHPPPSQKPYMHNFMRKNSHQQHPATTYNVQYPNQSPHVNARREVEESRDIPNYIALSRTAPNVNGRGDQEYDPTLRCHYCNKKFNFGQIQELRNHLNAAHPIHH